MSEVQSLAGTVVVGVDGSRSARQALQWAALWAAAAQLPVTAVAALGNRPEVPSADPGPSADFGDEVRRMVEREIAAVMQTSPGVRLEYRGVWGEADTALIEASRYAEMLVVGTRGLGGWRGVLLGGVSDKVTSGARGTVVVVPPHGKLAVCGDEPVTLAVADPATAGPSLTFAVAAARTFSVPLQLVHAWQVDRRSAVLGTSWGARRVRAARLRAQHRLDEVARMARELAGSAQGPTMSSRLVEATAAHALVQASEESCLVVTGTRGRAGWSGLLLGSRSRELAQEAACPVAIVRERD
ncbi:MAG: universal stress protein [Austwickia sp.]|nr:universal stress protein [Austwickia sp.]